MDEDDPLRRSTLFGAQDSIVASLIKSENVHAVIYEYSSIRALD
jgi:hypothetical protein